MEVRCIYADRGCPKSFSSTRGMRGKQEPKRHWQHRTPIINQQQPRQHQAFSGHLKEPRYEHSVDDEDDGQWNSDFELFKALFRADLSNAQMDEVVRLFRVESFW